MHRYFLRSIRFSAPFTWGPATIRPGPPGSICSWEELFDALRATFNGVEATPSEKFCQDLKIAALGELFDFSVPQRGLIADPRILGRSRHVLEHPVALRRTEKPMGLLPVGAQQLRKRIAGTQAHANAVRARQHRQRAHQILNVCDSHGGRKIAESRAGCQLISSLVAC